MKNYFVYLPEGPTAATWGCSATSIGFTRIVPGESYPPLGHPSDHHFTWERGRILQSYHLVWISEGRGTFESESTPAKIHLHAGCVFLLFPGVWHRYTPVHSTGWVEHWIEIRGGALERVREQGLIHPARPVQNGCLTGDIAETFAKIHSWATENAVAHQDLISCLGLYLLALIAQLDAPAQADDDKNLIQQSKVLMLNHLGEPLNMARIADKLKIGYAHFRQIFKARTGTSPKQYHLHLRLDRARSLLANTDKPLKEIAALLGFNSAFHFSSQFKAAMQICPSEWRGQQRRKITSVAESPPLEFQSS